MSQPAPSSLPSAGAAIRAVHPAQIGLEQVGSINPCQLFSLAAQTMLHPWSTGFQSAAPLWGAPLQPAAATAMYSQSLASGLSRVQRSWSSKTLDSRGRVQRVMAGWLASLPPIFRKGWHNLEPLDIICFMESVWLPYHAGSELPNGGKVVAPSSLSGGCLVSSLSAFCRCPVSALSASLFPSLGMLECAHPPARALPPCSLPWLQAPSPTSAPA